MDAVNPTAFLEILSKINDGFQFERFAQDLLCQIIGTSFTPLGGVKDRALDGLDHCSTVAHEPKAIYQISIEKNPKAKLQKTISALKANQIHFDRLFYVTNQVVEDQDTLEEELYKEHQVTVRCRDANWLRGNINKNEGAVRTYLAFIEAHYHEFASPGSSGILADFESDPRVFVFLRQQWQHYGHQEPLDILLTDSLIILALEGTDPDSGIFLTRDEIFSRISKLVSFSPKTIDGLLDQRLEALSKKTDRKINFHREGNKYCLPYATRLHVAQQNLEDVAIFEAFMTSAERRLKAHLAIEDVTVKDTPALLVATLNLVFKQQGLEFSNFVAKAQNLDAVEKSLPDIIASVVEKSSVIPPNRDRVKSALLGAIREMIYKGSDAERQYLQRASQSYMMLFLLQCDPKVCTYFRTMASNMSIFVCTSILVPALSEHPLPERHRRHWNLLVNANRAGVKLLINKVILSELVGHIRKSLKDYEENFAGREDIFSDPVAFPYIKEILIRSFFYKRAENANSTFDDFIDSFVTPTASQQDMEDELLEFLKAEFGIRFVQEEKLGITINQDDLKRLSHELGNHKHSAQQAESDARTILSIYAVRDKNGERGDAGIYGYKTWWLSKDTVTQRAVNKCFKGTYPTSCYLRPDFLLNYISLAPATEEAERVFDSVFPTLMGVTLSHHMQPEVPGLVNEAIKQHSDKSPARIRAILRTLSDRLKTDPATANRTKLKHFLDEEFKK